MIDSYLSELATRISRHVENARIAVGGSAALGDLQPSSDLDVLVFVSSPLTESLRENLAEELSHRALPCPAHGLDLGMYRLDQLGRREPEFELGFATGRDWRDEIEMGGIYPGGIVDIEIARRHGIALVGPSPTTYIPEVPVEWLREELAAVIPWHRRHLLDAFHDPTGANAVLNAARAWLFFSESRFASKSEGAGWAAHRSRYPELLREAAIIRSDGKRTNLPREDVLTFLDEAETELAHL